MEQTLRLELEAAHSRAEKAETEVKALREALKLAARPSKLQQFIVIAQDHPESLERRMLARSAHLDRAKDQTGMRNGRMLMAGALMSNIDSAADCKMKGSILVVEFPSEQDVKDWIAQDPYVLGNVWKDWTISPFRMAPFPQ